MSVSLKQLRSVATRCIFNPNKPKTAVERFLAETTDLRYLVRRSLEDLEYALEKSVDDKCLIQDRLSSIEKCITLLLLAVANAENRKDTGNGRLSGQGPAGEGNPDSSGRQT